MKLLEQILSSENLKVAYERVRKNKGASGVDGMTTEELGRHLKKNLRTIKDAIRNRTYTPKPVKRVEIPKENGKTRKLGIPSVTDRLIQQAIHQVLSPIYEQQFSTSSYGFRPGISAQDAVLKSVETMNQGKDWIVDIDLERFFDTVHHDRLMNLIARTVDDGDVISLIRKYLVSGVMVGKTYEDTQVGTPQGGNISPLLSNIMLNELDKELEERGLHFVRYADDCIIFTGSKKSAERVMKSITRFIEEKLGLKVNATKSKIGRPKDIKYLGYGFYKDKKGTYHLVPHKQSVQKFMRTLKRLTKRNWSVSLTYRLEKLREVIVGWVNYFKLGRMKTALRTIDQKLRSRIRVIIWKQWKVSKRQIAGLVRLGIDEESAKGITWCRKGYQYIGHSRLIQMAINNSRLKQRGLVSARDHYLKVHTAI